MDGDDLTANQPTEATWSDIVARLLQIEIRMNQETKAMGLKGRDLQEIIANLDRAIFYAMRMRDRAAVESIPDPTTVAARKMTYVGPTGNAAPDAYRIIGCAGMGGGGGPYGGTPTGAVRPNSSP